MSHSLTSHEDLTPYIEELLRVSNQTQSGLERRRSFDGDPETIIKEQLTELMNCRKNAQKVETIAKKFLEAYNTSLEDQTRLQAKIKSQNKDIGELNTLMQKYRKELEIKENRFESLTHEATDMERALKIINSECSQIKKERDNLKKELQNKEQMIIVRENAIKQRKDFMIEVEKEKEKDKEKEIDKTLQKKYDQLVLNHKKCITEIEDLKSKIYEIEDLWALDKKESDKLRISIGGLRDELFAKKIEYEELLQKYREVKDRTIHLKEELMMEKAQNENLMKEHDRQKSTGFKNDFEVLELQDTLKHEGFKRSRTEVLSDFFGDIEENHKNESGFFTINSTNACSPKFVLINTKKTETLKPIFILPNIQTISLVRNKSIRIFQNNEIQLSPPFSYLPALGLSIKNSFDIFETSDIKKSLHSSKHSKNSSTQTCENLSEKPTLSSSMKIDNSQPNLLETQSFRCDKAKGPSSSLTLCKFSFNLNFKRSSLDTVKLDDIFITKIPIFTFDDAASVESIETEASRTHKMTVMEARDPIKEFFIFVSYN